MTPFDWLLFRRTLAVHLVAVVVTGAVVAATDEVTSTVAMRAARLCAFSPFIGVLAVLSVALHARSRGELRAVEALGASPGRASWGAALCALGLSVVALAVLASPWADASSLFPAVRSGAPWLFAADGRSASALGVVVHADGRIVLPAVVLSDTALVTAGLAAIPCLGPIALLSPLWSVAPMSRTARGASLGLTGALTLIVLHLVAVGRIAAGLGAVAGLPLALALWDSHRRQRAGHGLTH